jgi:RAD51-like protein 3
VKTLRTKGIRSRAAYLLQQPDWIVANIPTISAEVEVSVSRTLCLSTSLLLLVRAYTYSGLRICMRLPVVKRWPLTTMMLHPVFFGLLPSQHTYRCPSPLRPSSKAATRARIVADATAIPERCDEMLARMLGATPTNDADGHSAVGFTVVTTGCTAVDRVLGGGLHTAEVTELVGGSSVGKTQLCHHLAVVAAGHHGRVVYIDTNGSFSAARVEEMAGARGLSPDAVLPAIEYRSVTDAAGLLRELHQLRATAATAARAAIIVDSVAAVFTPVLGRQQIKGSAMLAEAGAVLQTIAAVGRCVVLTTNYGYIDKERGSEKPGLGPAWASVPHCRLQLNRDASTCVSGRRIVTLTKSNRLPTGASAPVCIAAGGLVDVG